jgi:hypothetical protein
LQVPPFARASNAASTSSDRTAIVDRTSYESGYFIALRTTWSSECGGDKECYGDVGELHFESGFEMKVI